MAFVLDASAAVAWASPDEAPSAELAAAVASALVWRQLSGLLKSRMS
jgi:hypothetical protein